MELEKNGILAWKVHILPPNSAPESKGVDTI
jgi:hypothetical protein